MSKEDKERLNQLLIHHLNTIHETFQVLNQTPPSSLTKSSWDDVVKLGEHLYKQATTVGMLWTGEGPDAKALEETMASYANLLQGLLLLSHGTMIGAGTTLSSSIHSSVKQVIDCSFMLLKESIASFGNTSKSHKLSIPQIVGTVWDACTALKKTPGSNITAIGRAITQIAVSVKDVLREMKELKPTSMEVSIPNNNKNDTNNDNNDDNESDESSEGDLGGDLSHEEMKVANLAINVVSETLSTIKEIIRSITGLLKKTEKENEEMVESLEKLLVICRNLGLQVDEIGACLYPPQEVSAIRGACEKMVGFVGEMKVEMEKINGCSEGFVNVSDGLMSCLKELDLGLECCSDDEIVSEMENLVVGS